MIVDVIAHILGLDLHLSIECGIAVVASGRNALREVGDNYDTNDSPLRKLHICVGWCGVVIVYIHNLIYALLA